MAIADQFTGLDMKNLIGGPLAAACEASVNLADATANFIDKVGFDSEGKMRDAKFQYEQKDVDDEGNLINKSMEIKVPLLSIVPIPNLQIDEVNINFDMEVKEATSSASSFDAGGSFSASAKFLCFKVKISGSVSSHSSNTRSTDNSAKYHVDVRATNHGTPEGMARVLDMMAATISPTLIGTRITDENGNELSEASKAKYKKLKTLEKEQKALEVAMNAAKGALDEKINNLLRIANTYKNKYTNALNSKIADTDDSDKEEKYSGYVDEITESWRNFEDDVRTIVSAAALEESPKSETYIGSYKTYYNDSVTDLKQNKSDYNTLDVKFRETVTAQKNASQKEEELSAKIVEYNNVKAGVEVDDEVAKLESKQSSNKSSNTK